MTGIERADRDELARYLSASRITHLYALADLDEPFWSASTWYRRGEVFAGIVSAGTDWMTGYAMATTRVAETLALMIDVSDRLSPGAWITGPRGLAAAFEGVRSHDDKGAHHRMILRHPDRLVADHGCTPLGEDDLPAIGELVAAAPGEVFFQPSMIPGGCWYGVRQEERLVAMAGTHVVSDDWSVGAIGGVLTHPAHRGRGLGARTTSAVAHALGARVDLVGLNVAADNVGARRIYERLGFETAVDFEEVQLL